MFDFNGLNDGGDAIADFRNRDRSVDRFVLRIRGDPEGRGHPSPEQFQTGEGRDTQDADVRFIFDTRNETLWLDRNGSGAGGLSLVADLRADADLTHRDIWLV